MDSVEDTRAMVVKVCAKHPLSHIVGIASSGPPGLPTVHRQGKKVLRDVIGWPNLPKFLINVTSVSLN